MMYSHLNDNIIFRASNQSGQDQDILYSACGTALIPYKFESTGRYTIHIRILQVNFIPIQPSSYSFSNCNCLAIWQPMQCSSAKVIRFNKRIKLCNIRKRERDRDTRIESEAGIMSFDIVYLIVYTRITVDLAFIYYSV